MVRIFGRRRRRAGSDPERLSPLERLGLGIEQTLLPDSSVRYSGSRAWVPEVRVVDRPRELRIRVISSEFDPRGIRIELSGRVLTLSAATGHHGYHAFRRRILLPKEVDGRRTTARAGGHVLTLRIPKSVTG
jgi:HSP20 family molecular chaperone IbpA